MAVTIKVTGNGHFAGAETNLSGYTVQEDSTPIVGGDNSGGVGQIDFSVIEDASPEGTILLLNDTIELTDDSNGRTNGDVTSLSVNDGAGSVSAVSRLGRLVATRTVQPFTGTLQAAFTYYFSLAGITTGFTVDPAIASRTVSYIGFTGDVWDWLKQICTAQQIEISLVSSNIVVRPIRGRVAEVAKNSSVSWGVANGDIARSVRVWAYGSTRKVSTLVYPTGGWNSDVSVYQVDAGEIFKVNIPIDVSIESLQQPTIVSTVDRDYTGPNSVYSVSGNDGLPIPVQQWIDGGGSLTVAIGEDTRSIDVTIIGAVDLTGKYAPYRIAVSSGPSNYYSSLRIMGTGVFYGKKSYDFSTGITPDRTATEIGVEVDYPSINTVAEAYTVGLATAQKWAGADQTINVSATVINRKGDKGAANYPTFAAFDADYAGKTFAQFNTDWTGKTFADFNNTYYAKVADNFENQAFGNVAGARVQFRQAMYRIRSASTTESGIQYSAERDTTFGDFDSAWTGKTFADFNARHASKTFGDFGVIPLWT